MPTNETQGTGGDDNARMPAALADLCDRKIAPPWRWQDFGSGYMLVTDYGGARVVFCGAKGLQVRDGNGYLVPLTPEHPVAKLILDVCNSLPDRSQSEPVTADIPNAQAKEDAEYLRGLACDCREHEGGTLAKTLDEIADRLYKDGN